LNSNLRKLIQRKKEKKMRKRNRKKKTNGFKLEKKISSHSLSSVMADRMAEKIKMGALQVLYNPR
jgi:hypothetical protein